MKKQEIITTDVIGKASTGSVKPAITIGLSACLAGHQVRYNGGHTQSRLCLNVLSQHFTFKTFCPEVAAGFGTPRPAMRLTGNPDNPVLAYSHDERSDITSQLTRGFEKKLPEFDGLDGYILMKNSPSCGLERVKVYQSNGHPHPVRTTGLFARALTEKYPLMPVEEEGRLHDTGLFENFVVRVYAYHNFRHEVLSEPDLHKLITFHSSYKYLLMAHDQQAYRELGCLLAMKNKPPVDELSATYFERFMRALAKPADKKNHTNTLLHLLGYLKKVVSSPARQHIAEVIHKYRQGALPLITPLTLLKHYFDQHGSQYIKNQRYLNPYPETMNPHSKYY